MVEPVRMKDALKRVLGSLGLEKRLKEADAISLWPDVVGERIAKVTSVLGFENGVLRVGVKDPIWRQELSMMGAEIKQKLNERLGSKIVEEIRFR
jgi:predicted nucleic acid-binding Zn ribbon protein